MFLNAIIPSARAVQPSRAFSTSAASLAQKQFIVVARDYTDPDALNRRLNVRSKHLVGAAELKKAGALHLGGALLTDHSESGKMIGSVMIFNAESEREVAEIIERDEYVTGKVWEHYQILPFRQASF
ncbi:hypothetical protein BGX21_008473 [Mortierella sp. AD011]|nr:hypothetical protein BGX20_007635 [Mortierella sp. AD010]KAF9397836.1 hypothetical protein BGX21_008473 [Mortierella sp. AD011]